MLEAGACFSVLEMIYWNFGKLIFEGLSRTSLFCTTVSKLSYSIGAVHSENSCFVAELTVEDYQLRCDVDKGNSDLMPKTSK